MKSSPPVVAIEVAPQTGGSYPELFEARMGVTNWRKLGDVYGLTQFGINLETFEPGAQSALRHWHTLSDEFVYVLEGEMVLRMNDDETTLRPGMCVGFKAGVRNGHHFVNRSDKPARMLVMGSRVPGNNAFYPDDDLMWVEAEEGKYAAHKDGTPYPKRAR